MKKNREKKPKKKSRRIFRTVLLLWLVFLLLCGTVPPLFHRTAEAAELPPGDPGERVLSIDDNTEALIWRLRTIENAKKELILSYYGFADDESGRDFMAALLAAGDRGVKIRLLVDGFNLGLSSHTRFRALAGHPNIEIRIYNPINLFLPWRANYRMHDKYIIADGQVYILGGRNIKNVSLGNYMEQRDQDRDVLVYSPEPGENSSITGLTDYFEKIWNLSCSRKQRGPLFGGEKALKELRSHYEELHRTCPRAFEPADLKESTLPSGGIVLLSGEPEPKNKKPVIWETLIKLMEQGQESMIQTPYLTCNGKMYEDLRNLTEAGKNLSIVLNSPQTGANLFCSVDYLNQKSKIRDLGGELYECYGAHSIHTKTILIDDRISVIGSFNCDMRSAYLDTELMLVIDCPELNADLRRQVREDMDSSLHLLPDGREIPGASWTAAELPAGKKILYGILRALVLPIRQLL